ncbi:HNH endonuclease [Streptomyces odontomachi]|uniref:HNH endonuclease n=1 Tax=Streptomyces odontomachi TaxID=2944940 RepID=UPI00210B4A06|nr:HNH endonuclease [Streptomyces sp. ODS25]
MSRARTARPVLQGDTRRRFLAHLAGRDGARCYYCRTPFDAALSDATLDHYVPYCVWPENRPRNLVLACEPCNQAKADRLPYWVTVLLDAAVNTPGRPFTVPGALFTTHGTPAWDDLFQQTVNTAVNTAMNTLFTVGRSVFTVPLQSVGSTGPIESADRSTRADGAVNGADWGSVGPVVSRVQWRVLARLARACESALNATVNTDRHAVNSRERLGSDLRDCPRHSSRHTALQSGSPRSAIGTAVDSIESGPRTGRDKHPCPIESGDQSTRPGPIEHGTATREREAA